MALQLPDYQRSGEETLWLPQADGARDDFYQAVYSGEDGNPNVFAQGVQGRVVIGRHRDLGVVKLFSLREQEDFPSGIINNYVWYRQGILYLDDIAIPLTEQQQISLHCAHQEARVLYELEDDPGVVNITQSGLLVDPRGTLCAYISMGFAGRPTLRDLINQRDVAKGLDALIEVGDTLERCHEKRICHKDIKPSNIVIHATGGKLCDFGISRTQAPSTSLGADIHRERLGVGVGTPGYIAPELARGAQATPAADWYSFTLTGIEVITGVRTLPLAYPRWTDPNVRDLKEMSRRYCSGRRRTLKKSLRGLRVSEDVLESAIRCLESDPLKRDGREFLEKIKKIRETIPV